MKKGSYIPYFRRLRGLYVIAWQSLAQVTFLQLLKATIILNGK